MAVETLRCGAYICISAPRDAFRSLAAVPVPALTGRLALHDEFLASHGHPAEAVAFLRTVECRPGALPDAGLTDATAIVHVASHERTTVDTFCADLVDLLRGLARIRILSGTVQSTRYTGGAMHEFAYAHQRAQEDGDSMPVAFMLPLRKSPDWWGKDWMERHTYFLPRYGADGAMVSEGHPLAASAGIPALMRRTYRCGDRPSPSDGYDFLTYFECAEADIATFHAVCDALRDVRRNPEWQFVQEGPTWQGRRVRGWAGLWTAG